MNTFFVLYGDHNEYFVCQAENATHAAEQCKDHNGEAIHGVFLAVQDDSWMVWQTS
jgi:hypothetical protein